MSKFLNKYVRKTHRWLALPFVVLILTMFLARNSPVGSFAQQGQQFLILMMAITGLYLFLLPWWAKWKRTHKGSKGD